VRVFTGVARCSWPPRRCLDVTRALSSNCGLGLLLASSFGFYCGLSRSSALTHGGTYGDRKSTRETHESSDASYKASALGPSGTHDCEHSGRDYGFLLANQNDLGLAKTAVFALGHGDGLLIAAHPPLSSPTRTKEFQCAKSCLAAHAAKHCQTQKHPC
jgi:hypothetical protein